MSIGWDGTDEKEYIKVRGPKPAGSTSGLTPSVLRMAPRGDMALAEIQRHIYTVTVPQTGSAPTVNLGNPSKASVPARRLTDIGGEFPAWGLDGRIVHFSLGNAHFLYNLDDAQAFEDSVKAASKAEEDDGEGSEEADEVDETDAVEEEGDGRSEALFGLLRYEDDQDVCSRHPQREAVHHNGSA